MNKQLSSKTISIITVNYFSASLIKHLASTLPNKKKHNYEFIVVDNSSNKEQSDLLKKIKKIDKLIINRKNLGFGTANNQGVKRAKGQFVFFLNPDTMINDSTLDQLLMTFNDDKRVAMAGCLIRNTDGSLQRSAHRSFPNMWNHFWEYSPIVELLFSRLLPNYHPTLFSTEEHLHELKVQHLLGACMLMPKKNFDFAGGFDENIFLYREETDLAKRLLENGYSIRYTAKTSITHVSGGSTQNRGRTSFDEIYTKSAYQYLDKHYGNLYMNLAKFAAITGLLLSLITLYPLHLFRLILHKPGFRQELKGSLISLKFHYKHLNSNELRYQSKKNL